MTELLQLVGVLVLLTLGCVVLYRVLEAIWEFVKAVRGR